MKTLKELKKLTSDRLLSYYQAERNRMFRAGYQYCILGENEDGSVIMGWIGPNNDTNLIITSQINYINLIKSELDSRTHVKR